MVHICLQPASQDCAAHQVGPNLSHWSLVLYGKALDTYASPTACHCCSPLCWRAMLWDARPPTSRCRCGWAVQFLIHKTPKWQRPCLLFKADISKAFDSLSWPALFDALWDVYADKCPHAPSSSVWSLTSSCTALPKTGRQFRGLPTVLPFLNVLYSIAAHKDDLLLIAPNQASLASMVLDLPDSLAGAGFRINLTKCLVLANAYRNVSTPSLQLCGSDVPAQLPGHPTKILGCTLGWKGASTHTPDAAMTTASRPTRGSSHHRALETQAPSAQCLGGELHLVGRAGLAPLQTPRLQTQRFPCHYDQACPKAWETCLRALVGH